MTEKGKLPTRHQGRATVVLQELHRGQQVVAGEEAIGEVLDVLPRDAVHYLHVLRYGPGLDELYIPVAAIRQVVGNHVYLDLEALDLIGQAWHQLPMAIAAG
jgi:hypothetical protein